MRRCVLMRRTWLGWERVLCIDDDSLVVWCWLFRFGRMGLWREATIKKPGYLTIGTFLLPLH
jgi:hypothetical protein